VRREVAAGLVQHVGGHLHGGQWRAQLVRDVGGESLLQLRERLQLGDLALQAVGHRVEALRQPGQVVLAADGHPLLELPLGQPLGGAGRPPDRVDDEPRDHHPDARHEQRQHDPDDEHRVADAGEALLLLVQGEGVVELDLLAALPVTRHRRAHQQRGPRFTVGVGHQGVLVRLVARVDVGAEVAGDRRVDVPAARRAALGLAGPVDHDDVEVAGRRTAGQQRLHRPVERRAHAGGVARGDAGHLALRVEDPALRLVDRGLALDRQHLVADLAEQHEADDDHDRARHDHGDGADAHLQRRAPGVQGAGGQVAQPALRRSARPLRPAGEATADALRLLAQPRLPRGGCGGRRPRGGVGDVGGGHEGGVTRPTPLTAGPPCSRRRAPSARPRASPDRARSWRAAAARGR
jgi:hypothetical protein